MKNWILKLVALAALSASAVFAQTTTTYTAPTPTEMAARVVVRLTTLLDLTTDQQTQATTLFTTEFTTLSGLQTARDTAQTAFTTAVKGNDANSIAAVATTLGGLETQSVTAKGTADAAFYALLTTTQQTKLNTLNSSFDVLGGPGPGGFGGGPGGRH